MALTVIKPSGIDTSGNYTVNGMNVSANISVANLSATTSANLGAVGNITITGGSSGQVLSTNGSGGLSFISVSSSGISNGNSNVNIATANGNVTVTAVGNTTLTVTGTGANVFGTLSVSGNATIGGNLITSGAGGGNITGANVVSANLFTGTLTTAAQPNITSVGTLTSVSVSGNVTGGNLRTAGTITANGGAYGEVVTTQFASVWGSGGGPNPYSIMQVRSSDNVSGIGMQAFTGSGTLYGNTNIIFALGQVRDKDVPASLVTKAYVDSTGFIANGIVSASGNVTGGNLITGGVISATGNANVGNIGTTNLVATGTGSFGANVNMNSYWINNVGYPSLTTDVATKSYVDTMISTGIAYHQPVAVATTTTLATATGGTTSYVSPNGAANGIGAYISTTGTYLNIDSANVQTVGTRILVKDEANATWNGIYTYANTTAIVRSTDTDEYGPDSTTQLSINDYFFVQGGTVNKGIAYIVSSPTGTITFGTSNIVFSEFSTSQVYTAGTGIAITGTVISANASQTQITSVGTLTSLSVSGNATIGNLSVSGVVNTNLIPVGNGVQSLGNATNQWSNLYLTGNTIYLGNATISSNASSIVLTTPAGGQTVIAGNTGNSDISGQTLSISGNATIGNIISSGTGGNITGANVVSANTLTASGNITANFYIGNGSQLTGLSTAGVSNGNSNVNIATANGNVTITSAGNTTLTVTGTGANVSGTLSVSGNASFANLTSNGTGGNISGANVISANTVSVSGNATIGNIISSGSGGNITGANVISANLFTGTLTTAAQPNITSTGTLASLSVTGNGTFGNVSATTFTGALSGAATSATTAGTVTTAAQPNITSTGTLSSISVSGTSNLGAVGNVTITGGSSGQVLSTNGSGGLSFISVSSSGISNGNSNVNIATANGNVTITAVGNTTMTVTGTGANISGTLSVSGNAAFANLTSNGTGGNITGANVISANTVSVSGNATIGNIISSGSGGNITGANVISANLFTGTLTTAAQPNITSVGTLASLTINSAIGLGGATYGSNGQVLTSGGSGAVPTWTTPNAASATYVRTSFTATASQTTFTVAYTVGYAEVFLNGVLLNSTDYTASNGTTIVLGVGATLNDIVEVIAYNVTSLGTATLATNIAGGTTGVFPYQTGPNVTGFTTNLTFDGSTLSSSTTAASGLSLNTSTAGKAHILLKSAGTQKAIIGLAGAILGTNSTDVGIIADAVGGAIKFYANGVTTNSGTFNQYGFGIGAAVPSSGQGITFPASQDPSSNANTLDDYEEGTWTPTITFGGGSTGVTYSNQKGNYTKIGNRVFISCYLSVTNKGSSSGSVVINGLPFTSSSATNMFNNVCVWADGLSSITGSLQAYNAPNTSTVSEITQLGTGIPSILTNSNCTTNPSFMVNFSYSI